MPALGSPAGMLLAAFWTLLMVGSGSDAWNVGPGPPPPELPTPVIYTVVTLLVGRFQAATEFGPLRGPSGDPRSQDWNSELIRPTPPAVLPNRVSPVVVSR